MKRVVALLVLVTLLAPVACMNTSARASSGQVGEALTTLDGKPLSPAELEASIAQAMEKAKVAGLSVAITESRQFGINDGRIAYTHAFGYRDKATGAPFDTQTVTGAASLSKTVFAYLIMLLAEDGVIDLDKPLQAYLPKPLPDYPAYAYQNYTVTYADKGIGIVLLSNSNNFESVAREIVQAAIGDRYSPFEWLEYAPFDPSQVKTPPPEPMVIVVLIAVLALIVVVAVVAAVIAIWTKRKLRADPEYATLQEKRPEGYWMGIGMAIGVALGLPLGLPIGIAMDNIGLGPALGSAMGVAVGVAIGTALEQRHKGETRPLTSYEKRARQWTTWGGIAVLALLAAAAVAGVVAMLLR